jgi:hypothetical protein
MPSPDDSREEESGRTREEKIDKNIENKEEKRLLFIHT